MFRRAAIVETSDSRPSSSALVLARGNSARSRDGRALQREHADLRRVGINLNADECRHAAARGRRQNAARRGEATGSQEAHAQAFSVAWMVRRSVRSFSLRTRVVPRFEQPLLL